MTTIKDRIAWAVLLVALALILWTDRHERDYVARADACCGAVTNGGLKNNPTAGTVLATITNGLPAGYHRWAVWVHCTVACQVTVERRDASDVSQWIHYVDITAGLHDVGFNSFNIPTNFAEGDDITVKIVGTIVGDAEATIIFEY